MRRRDVIALVGSAAATWPLTTRAQQPNAARRVGVLMNGTATDAVLQSYVDALVSGLDQLGWRGDRNLHVDLRWSGGDAELARIYAAQLIGLMPDVIVAVTTTNLIAVRQATSTIPVVFLSVSDPVEQGFVTNVAKPGGNLTGFSAFEFSIGGKWLELLKEIAPRLQRIGVMFNPDTSPQSKFFVRSVEAVAPSLGVETTVVQIRATADIEPAFETFARSPNSGLILTSDTFTAMRQNLIVDMASRYRLPAISSNARFAKDGGLMYYGVSVNVTEQFRQAAGYVDRILKGGRAGDLPVQQSDKYTLAINLKTAKALGLTVPLPLVGRADEVIE
ncbi:MAG TPA: ABC transporter substrate-binding protein [Xanthobacteraceae bacterium]|jgi:putative ABC transport system substrate-binding protein|nr:ABC transporter substrate-binding protein [Xanthobacteraceae bacterium]